MGFDSTEDLPYRGESPKDRLAYERYLADIKRGKSGLQLRAVAEESIPEIRRSWSARSFTPVSTSAGEFDAIVCNVSYYFHGHGQDFGSIRLMT
jgi:hypothetical protein